jgi:CBS domain containing-hemolysin-like protein
MIHEALTWIGIALCLSQSATFAGLNLAVFSLSWFRLEAEAADGNRDAAAVLAMRRDPNSVLATIAWGNVSVNVLLTILSNSVLTGVGAFLFSTIFITIFGEIVPQGYFSRHALKMAAVLSPLLRGYRVLLYPVVKPSALMLDAWLGKEAIRYFRESELKDIIRRHMLAEESEVDRIEAIGALNFLTIDDIPVEQEGVPIDPASIISFPLRNGIPHFSSFTKSDDDPLLKQINASGKSWVVIVDEQNQPHLMMDADGFLRHALFADQPTDPYDYCHRPVVIRNCNEPLGKVMAQLSFDQSTPGDHIITYDTILLWTDEPRLISGSDLLGRLLRGIVTRSPRKEAGAIRPSPSQ